jgi:hypothetical protein
MSVAAALLAATLSVGSAATDTLLVDTFAPPALETHPTNPDRAFIAASSNGPGVFEVRIAPTQALAYVGASYSLPGNVNCTESAPFNEPTIGNVALERGTGVTRGWITTSNCELVVPFNYASGAGYTILYSGQSRTSVPTKHTITGAFTRYQNSGAGAAITSFKTSFTSSALRVGNRLVVATSNIHQAGSNPIWNPGTVLFFALDDSGATTTLTPASPFFAITSDPNPVALTPLPGGRVAVTNAGIYDAGFPPLVTGQGSIDVLEVSTGRLVGSIPLGPGNPSGRGLALDPTSSVAVAGSATLRQLVAVDVRGIAALPAAAVDARLQRPSCNDGSYASAGGVPCLRKRVIRGGLNPIVLSPPPGASGVYSYVSQVSFGASGDFLAATSYNDGGLALLAFDKRNLASPHPLLASRFGVAQTIAATSPAGAIGQECCPGPMILHANSVGGLAGADVLFATASPNGILVRGHLGGTVAAASGDFDGDGIQDALDDCPVEANAEQTDSGGLATASPDGIGDLCQCGDTSDDGRIDAADVSALRSFLAGSESAPAAPEKCDVGGSAACDLEDSVRLRRALASLAPGISHVCTAFLP